MRASALSNHGVKHMQFTKPGADLYIPDLVPEQDALARTTHMAVGAHQDDLEIMAFHGIVACYGQRNLWFTGVVCTDGAGSSRSGVYADYTNAEMQALRKREQRAAAVVGHYGAIAQLDYSSSEIRNPVACLALRQDLTKIFAACKPRTVYLHNLADKHDTHVAAGLAAIGALRDTAQTFTPERVYGCEVWRGLDWMMDGDKIPLDVSARENLAAALTGLFDSQVAGGKRYDLATLGRRRANATYFASHGVDTAQMLSFAMDLTPLVRNPALEIEEYVAGHIRRFGEDVQAKLSKYRQA